jgi:meiotically up-regulated gene 157 (Mug157) protein
MLSVELANLALILGSLHLDNTTKVALALNFQSRAAEWSARIKQAIHQYGIAPDGTYAYEVNGLGSQYLMDDANVPSLMSLPYLGFLGTSCRGKVVYYVHR